MSKLIKINTTQLEVSDDVMSIIPYISFQLFGLPLNSAPVVVVVHALTGNSDVAGAEKGWWKTIIGNNKLVDTKRFTIIAFNIPGNNYDGLEINNYKSLTAGIIGHLFNKVLIKICRNKIFALMGGSLGGGIAWEMLIREKKLFHYVIPIACDWKSTDWIIAQSFVQEEILKKSSRPLFDARMMAMIFYRTQQSLDLKFSRSKTESGELFNIESWLTHHGSKLENRFSIKAYKLMNHLLKTIDITAFSNFEFALSGCHAEIIQIAINSDLMFPLSEARATARSLDNIGINNRLEIIDSVHGHDAFLIEFNQIEKFLKNIFRTKN